MPGHAVTKNRSGGPAMILAPLAVCLFACSKTRLGALSPILGLKAPLRTQSLCCNESRVHHFVIVLVWRGESRALSGDGHRHGD